MKLKYCLPIAMLFSGVLTGCGTVYTLEGSKYDSKEKMLEASRTLFSGVSNAVVPLPAPVSQKKLVCAIPSQLAFVNAALDRFAEKQGSAATGEAREIIETLTRSNFYGTKVACDAVIRRKIYSSTQFIQLDSVNGSYGASPDTDVVYLVEPSQNSAQWFFVTAKSGKQVFAYDRSSPTPAGKVQGFIDAIQVQAIKE